MCCMAPYWDQPAEWVELSLGHKGLLEPLLVLVLKAEQLVPQFNYQGRRKHFESGQAVNIRGVRGRTPGNFSKKLMPLAGTFWHY